MLDGRIMVPHLQVPVDWLQLSEAGRVGFFCDAFLAAWRRGENPRIEAFLEGDPLVDRQLLVVHLTALERDLRWQRGEAPMLGEYTDRFPQYREALAHAWEPKS